MNDYNKDNYEIKKSDIHGRGVFSNKNFSAGELINLAIDNMQATHFGGFLNHSDSPNAVTRKNKNKYYTFALARIKPGDEIAVDYTVNKDLEQPESTWKYHQEASPNNGVFTDTNPKVDDETISSLYKGTVPQGKNAEVEVDDDVEESTTANQPNPGFASGIDKSPDDSYLNLLKKSIKPTKIVINITKDNRGADPYNKVH
ncbi:MAG: SET domain-containing protein [Candidatus Aenigmarchaeota archaeon]|nr:SET domain-containing protein [Candidatus Aenigmarchaeota archaeon]